MFGVLLLVFLVVPFVELYVIIQVAHVIGALDTIALLIIVSAVGAWLVKREGLGVWRRAQRQIGRGGVPGNELVDGVLVLFAGALLLTPGFVTDVFGLLFLIPPSRDLIRKFGSVFFFRRVQVGARAADWGYSRVRGRRGPATGGPSTASGPDAGRRPPRPRSPRAYDVEGEAQEIRDESLLDPPDEPRR